MGWIADTAMLLERVWNKLPRWLRHCILRVRYSLKGYNEVIDDNLDLRRRLEVVQAELQGLRRLKQMADDTITDSGIRLKSVEGKHQAKMGELKARFEAQSGSKARQTMAIWALLQDSIRLNKEMHPVLMRVPEVAQRLYESMHKFGVPVVHFERKEPELQLWDPVWDVMDSARAFFERFGPALDRMIEVSLIRAAVAPLRGRMAGPKGKSLMAEAIERTDEDGRSEEQTAEEAQES